jgi:hypothetical protein
MPSEVLSDGIAPPKQFRIASSELRFARDFSRALLIRSVEN